MAVFGLPRSVNDVHVVGLSDVWRMDMEGMRSYETCIVSCFVLSHMRE